MIEVKPNPDFLKVPAEASGKPVAMAETKWGDAISSGVNGYQLVPDVLLRRQADLRLDATDIVILLNIAMHWWESAPEKMPYPRPATIAQRMGVSRRTVERHIARLEDLRLLEWKPPESRVNAPSIRRFDMDRLRSALERLALRSNTEDAND
jgi:hypothetical protein